MAVDLATLDLILDILVKSVFLMVFIAALLVLRNIDRVVKSAERSAESIERTAETLETIAAFTRYLPKIGRKHRDED